MAITITATDSNVLNQDGEKVYVLKEVEDIKLRDGNTIQVSREHAYSKEELQRKKASVQSS